MSKGMSSQEFLEANPELNGRLSAPTVVPVEKMNKVRGRLSAPTFYDTEKGGLVVSVGITYPSDEPPVSQRHDIFFKVFFAEKRYMFVNGNASELGLTGKDKGNFNRNATKLSNLLAAAGVADLTQVEDREILFDAGPAWNDQSSYDVYQVYSAA